MMNLGSVVGKNGLLWGIGAASLAAFAFVAVVSHPSNQKASITAPHPQSASAVSTHEVLASYGKLPIAFEANLGQTDPGVKFLAHGSSTTLFLTKNGAVLRLRSGANGQPHTPSARGMSETIPPAKDSNTSDTVVRIAFAGSNPDTSVQGLDQQPGHSNYIVGRDPSRWRTNVPQFARVKYSSLYPGVNMIFYGHEGTLESDYTIAPGADPNAIALRLEGAQRIKPDNQGNLVLSTSAGDVLLGKPQAFQEIAGIKREIAAQYVLRNSQLAGIQLAAYDRTQPLVIDPIIGYSTLLGGTASETGNAIAVDSNGDAYICGNTNSADFPATTGAYQTSLKAVSATNAFVAELNPAGTALIFATYFGGTGSDTAYGIGVDSGANAYITGTTTSFDLPTAATSGTPIMSQFPPGNLGTTGFFAEFSTSGSVLAYSTYLGGNTRDIPAALAVDSSANVYIVGTTSSSNFPLSTVYNNAFQTFSNSVSNGGSAAFLSKINTNSALPGLQALLYSTFFGGSDTDGGAGVAADSHGNAYITGTAASTDFPITAGAFQSSISPGDDVAYVTRLDTTQAGAASLIYSSFLGGTGTGGGSGTSIATDANFNAYIGGTTFASDFPVSPNAFISSQPAAGYIMAFVARFNTNASGANSRVYSTYLGGSNVSGNYVYGIAADSLGDAYVTGSTFTKNYPVTGGTAQPVQNGISNSILTVVNPAGTGLLFSTYWGGTTNDQGNGIALDTASTPNAYFVGTAKSANFPTTAGAYQTTHKGFSDAFIVKMSPGAAQGVFVTPTSIGFGNQGVNSTSTAQTVTLSNNQNAALSNIAITFTGANPGDFAQTNTCGETTTTTGSLTAFQSCTISITFTPSISGAESATMNVADSATGSPQTVALTGTGTAVALSPSTLSFGTQAENTTSPAQTVTLTNNGTTVLSNIAITIIGANAGDFAQTNTCPVPPATLAASGGNCTISVTFTPSTQAAESATLQVSDSDPSSPQTVALSGTGTKPTSGVTVSPSSLSFGNQAQGTASPAMNVTLSNTGSAQLTGITFTFTGTNATDFSETDTCGAPGGTLASNASCVISVTFKPSTAAAESASLSIADSAPTSPQSVPITGTGTAPVTSFAISLVPTSATIKAGQTFTGSATVTSENSFNSAVTLSFGGCPGDSLCSATSNPLTPAANASVSTQFTIQTDLTAGGYPRTLHFPTGSQWPIWAWTLLSIVFLLTGFWAARRRSVKSLAFVFGMILLMGLASCTGTPSTPTGTYQIQIKGTSGNQSFPATFTLTVQ